MSYSKEFYIKMSDFMLHVARSIYFYKRTLVEDSKLIERFSDDPKCEPRRIKWWIIEIWKNMLQRTDMVEMGMCDYKSFYIFCIFREK